MREDEKTIISLIAKGVFRIDDQGQIWRTGVLTRTLNVKSIPAQRAEAITAKGYARVSVGMRRRTLYIAAHRMVWFAAGRAIPDGYELNHINGRRADNRLSNLEIVTKSGNLQHSYDVLQRTRLAGEMNAQHKLTWEQVREIRARFADGEPKRSLARAYGVTPPLIRKIVNGAAWRDDAFPAVTA